MMFLLDTSIIVDALRGVSVALIFLGSLQTRATVSVITISEITAGLRKQREELEATRMFSLLNVTPVDHDIAVRAGQHLRHFGASHGVELADALIAATAEQHGLTLATLNVKHFPMFPKLQPPY